MNINDVKAGDLLTWTTKKEADDVIKKDLTWALMPVAVYADDSKWFGQYTHYCFAK